MIVSVVSIHGTYLGGLFFRLTSECLNDWGGRGYDDYVPGEITKTTFSGDRTT